MWRLFRATGEGVEAGRGMLQGLISHLVRERLGTPQKELNHPQTDGTAELHRGGSINRRSRQKGD